MTSFFLNKIMSLLNMDELSFHPKFRNVLLQSLISLWKKGFVESLQVLRSLCRELKKRSRRTKSLCKSMFHLVIDSNMPHEGKKENKPNERKIQNFLYEMVMGSDELIAKEILVIIAEFYRR